MVYLIKCDKTNTCKIGYASNPENRLSQLQTGNPFALELVGVVDGDISLERELHIKFDKYRIKGEWFEYSQEIKDFFDVDEFMMIYPELLPILIITSNPAKTLYVDILSNYANGSVFRIDKEMKPILKNYLKLGISSISNATTELVSNGLFIRVSRGYYQINPRYAFKGSTRDRARALKAIIEVEYNKK